MILRPDDIANKRFTRISQGEGYDMTEVDHFMDEVEAVLGRLHREVQDLRSVNERPVSTEPPLSAYALTKLRSSDSGVYRFAFVDVGEPLTLADVTAHLDGLVNLFVITDYASGVEPFMWGAARKDYSRRFEALGVSYRSPLEVIVAVSSMAVGAMALYDRWNASRRIAANTSADVAAAQTRQDVERLKQLAVATTFNYLQEEGADLVAVAGQDTMGAIASLSQTLAALNQVEKLEGPSPAASRDQADES